MFKLMTMSELELKIALKGTDEPKFKSIIQMTLDAKFPNHNKS